MSVNISTVHLDTLGIIHEYRLIADIYSWRYPEYEMKNPLKTGGNGRVFST
jgi:hypothetical protein